MNEGNKPTFNSIHTNRSGRSSETSRIEIQPSPSKVLELNLNFKFNFDDVIPYMFITFLQLYFQSKNIMFKLINVK